MSHAAHISSQTSAPAAFDLLLGLAAPVELAAQFAGRSPDDTGLEALAMRVVETGREQDPAVAERIRDLVSITQAGLEMVAKLRRAHAPPVMIRSAGNALIDELADSIAVIAQRIS
jgi:hypothetical protein